jgi:hypothetical protein
VTVFISLFHLFSSEESSLELVDDGVAVTFDLPVLEPGHGREEVSRISETIRTCNTYITLIFTAIFTAKYVCVFGGRGEIIIIVMSDGGKANSISLPAVCTTHTHQRRRYYRSVFTACDWGYGHRPI